jgi:hypothetical protein
LILIWSPITSAASSASGPNHLKLIAPSPAHFSGLHNAWHNGRRSVKPALALDPGGVLTKEWPGIFFARRNQRDRTG